MADIKNYLGYKVGDIISLSDLQTQKEFGIMSVDFRIIETRTYSHPDGIFVYTGYLASYHPSPEVDEQKILLLIRRVGEDFDLRVFYMDNDGPSDNFDYLFSSDEEDLIDRFAVNLNFEDAILEVTWDKQGTSNFGVDCLVSVEKEKTCRTIAEYFTNDDTRGNPHCFIEWTGDICGGYIEVWYGCTIRNSDVEMFHTK